jgi:ankyrin repeat protein
MLVSAGANVSLRASWCITRTPLQAAVEDGRKEIVDFLLEQGVDANETPAVRAGATSIQLAAIKGFIAIATTLLNHGAEVNAEPAPYEGRTAFEGATEHGRIEMMMFLFQNGADLLSDNRRQYERAIRFAEENGQHAAVQLAEELLREALSNEGARLMSFLDAGIPGCDMGDFEDFSFPN